MDSIQIGKLKEIVSEGKTLVFWSPDDRAGSRIVRVGAAPTRAGDEPEPAEVGFLGRRPGDYVALSNVQLSELVIGKRMEAADLE